MIPMSVFVAAEGYGLEACTVSDWREAWCAINRCYTEPDGSDGPLAWVVCMAKGEGPITRLCVMSRDMWEAIAETPDALRLYLLIAGDEPDHLLDQYCDDFEAAE